jgi:hypothetical protein
METTRSVRSVLALALALAVLGTAGAVEAGCGCQKPPPPRAAIRPFAGYVDQAITLFDDRLAAGQAYDVRFMSLVDGRTDWSRGRGRVKRDLADGALRVHLRVSVADVSLGPCEVSVWSGGVQLFALAPDAFTVTAAPIDLHDFAETVAREGYQAGVGSDGTLYITVDVARVTDATTFSGAANGLPLQFAADGIAIYNEQGFLMQLLDPKVPGLFRLSAGQGDASDALDYWRHEFRTYKQEHRKLDARRPDTDPDWHADGSYHVDHDHLIVAISGTLPDGSRLAPGATPPFELVVQSMPAAAL